MWNIIICVSRGGISMAEESKRFLDGDWAVENVQGKLISSAKKRVDGTWVPETNREQHYNEVMMSAMASKITSLTIVYSTVYSGADQRKQQSSASLAFARDRWIPRTKGQ